MKISTQKKNAILLIPLGVIALAISCSGKGTKIEYKEAEGYFVRNTVKNDGAYEKEFTTQESFGEYFGDAATMGAMPTTIDFDKEFVAAYIAPETNLQTAIVVDSVMYNGRQVEMWLSIETGDTMSYTIRPAKVLLIDKKFKGKLTSFVTSYENKND